jgi:hypothetical protein
MGKCVLLPLKVFCKVPLSGNKNGNLGQLEENWLGEAGQIGTSHMALGSWQATLKSCK